MDVGNAAAKMPGRVKASQALAERLKGEREEAAERAAALEREAEDLRAVERAAERALESLMGDLDPEDVPRERLR